MEERRKERERDREIKTDRETGSEKEMDRERESFYLLFPHTEDDVCVLGYGNLLPFLSLLRSLSLSRLLSLLTSGDTLKMFIVSNTHPFIHFNNKYSFTPAHTHTHTPPN